MSGQKDLKKRVFHLLLCSLEFTLQYLHCRHITKWGVLSVSHILVTKDCAAVTGFVYECLD